jgi:hypothetical protein
MNSIIAQATRNTRLRSWKVAIMAGALAVMGAGATPAMAIDQQASEAQLDEIDNWRGAAGTDAYAQGPYGYAGERYRAGPYVGAPYRSQPYAGEPTGHPVMDRRPHREVSDY